MNSNLENTKARKVFQLSAKVWFEHNLRHHFSNEGKIAIGSLAKLHGFDLL